MKNQNSLAVFVSSWGLHCDEKRCGHSQEMFKGKAKSPHNEIIIKEEKRSVMGTRKRTENIHVHPVVVKQEQTKLRNSRHTRIGVIKAIIQSSLPPQQKM